MISSLSPVTNDADAADMEPEEAHVLDAVKTVLDGDIVPIPFRRALMDAVDAVPPAM
jgi:hypothetical protein